MNKHFSHDRFHGKSTLEVALHVGCYNHIPGDGREFVAVDEGAVKVEEGLETVMPRL